MQLKQYSHQHIQDIDFESILLTEDVLSLLTRIYRNENVYFHENTYCYRIPSIFTNDEYTQLETSKLLPNQFLLSTHEQTLTDLKFAANQIDLRMAADAFVAAFSSASKRWLSVLPATILGLSIPEHEIELHHSGNCKICFYNNKAKTDLTEFILFAENSGTCWGEENPIDAVLTLKLANTTPMENWPKPNERDIWNFLQIIDHIKNLKNNERYSVLSKQIKSQHWFRGAHYQIEDVLTCLSFIGILEHPDYPGLMTAWTSAWYRDNRPNVRVEVPAPLAWWSGDFGINQSHFDKLFGHLTLPTGNIEMLINEPISKKRKKITTHKIKVIKGPIAQGDVFSVRIAEDRWGAVYCHEVKENQKGTIYGLVEFLDIIKNTPVEVTDLNQLAFKNRIGEGERSQYWVSGLNKVASVKCIAKEVTSPKSSDETPINPTYQQAIQLDYTAIWHFPSLRD